MYFCSVYKVDPLIFSLNGFWGEFGFGTDPVYRSGKFFCFSFTHVDENFNLLTCFYLRQLISCDKDF